MLGSDRPVPFDAEAIARRLQEPAIRSYLLHAKWDPEAIGNLLRKSSLKVWTPEEIRPADINTDLFPKDEFFLNTRKLYVPSLTLGSRS
jgi:hypothetical protein